MHAGESNFSAAANQYPQEAASAAVRVVATCVDGMKWQSQCLMKNHEERK